MLAHIARGLLFGAALILAVSIADAQQPDVRQKAKQARTKQPERPAEPSTSSGGIDYFSCHSGVLWVESRCRLRDGRVCTVDEVALVNCR